MPDARPAPARDDARRQGRRTGTPIRHPRGTLSGALDDEQAVLEWLQRAAVAARGRPPSPTALRHFNRAGQLLGTGDGRAAAIAYAAAVHDSPDFTQAYTALGLVLGQIGYRQAQIACCDIALTLSPHFAEAHLARGQALAAANHCSDSAHDFRKAVAIKPELLLAWLGLGQALMGLGRAAEAATAFAAAAARAPGRADIHIEHGNALRAAGDDAAALRAYAAALAARPGDAVAHCNIGCVLQDLGRVAQAADHYRKAVTKDPAFAQAHRNLGTVLQTIGQFDQAIQAYRSALRLRPNDTDAANFLASALMEAGQLAEAETAFASALALRPDDARTHFNHGLALLKAGKLREGWAEHEWRWRGVMPPLGISQPQWQGEAAPGSRILLHAEQGLGDTLQFVRYAPLVAARGLRVLLEVQPPLVRLAQGLPGVEAVIAAGGERPGFDLHCPLLSLAFAFGTDLHTVPATIPYLTADPDLLEQWRTRLPPATGLRAGLVWSGSPRPGEVRNNWIDARRSMELQWLAPLSAVAGVQWFNLQKDRTPDPAAGFAMTDLMPQVGDFADTAALVAHLDLVITVDTSMAHLAGAIGKPVWMLSRFDGCWRWLQGRDDTPWYPAMRLYRQEEPAAWAPVVARLANDLARWAGK